MSDQTSPTPIRRRRSTATNEASEPVKKSANSDWKDHPILYVCGAVVTTAFACLTYFNEFALPQRTSRLEDQAFRATEESRRLSIELNNQREIAKESRKEAEAAKARQRRLSALLLEARTADMFIYGTAYPNGFATVKVGMTAADVYAAYPKESITPDELGFLSVNLKNSPFSEATYYYDEKSERKIITHIAFRLKYEYGQENQNIVRRITESLGKPLVVSSRHFAWPTSEKANVFVSDKNSFLIMEEGSRPAIWPQEKEEEALCKELKRNSCPTLDEK